MPSVDIDFDSTMSIDKLSMGDWFIYDGEVYIRLEWVNFNVLRAFKVNDGNVCNFSLSLQVVPVDDDCIHISIKKKGDSNEKH